MHAFVFPGQGSQRAGMGEAWRTAPSWSVVTDLSDVTHRDIGRLLLDADADELRVTSNAQLATFTLSLLILDAVRASGAPPPTAVAGHSLGEYTALVAAGVLGVAAGAELVAARGAAMEAAATAQPGTMAAVLGLDLEAVARACAGVDEAWVANDNAPGQVVIAGTAAGVDAVAARARDLGAKRVIPLAVGGAFHTPLMRPALDALDQALGAADFAHALVDCVANVDAAVHTDAEEWRTLLSWQLTSPVRWRQSQVRLAELGISTFVELGPGSELSGMVKRTVPGAIRANVAAPGDITSMTSAP